MGGDGQSTKEDTQKRPADINICRRSNGCLAVGMVHCSLSMVLCLNILFYRCSHARSARAHTSRFLRVFVQIKQDLEV